MTSVSSSALTRGSQSVASRTNTARPSLICSAVDGAVGVIDPATESMALFESDKPTKIVPSS